MILYRDLEYQNLKKKKTKEKAIKTDRPWIT